MMLHKMQTCTHTDTHTELGANSLTGNYFNPTLLRDFQLSLPDLLHHFNQIELVAVAENMADKNPRIVRTD